MAIRIRNYYPETPGVPTPGMTAVCAAEEPEMPNDLYLHDGVHGALSDKFMDDWKSSGLWSILEEEHRPGVTRLINVAKDYVKMAELAKSKGQLLKRFKSALTAIFLQDE